MRESINDTLVALTLKVPHPEAINQLKLISCCNFIYKIISKIMVGRLKGSLNDHISPLICWGGGVILDNLFVAQKAFHLLKKKGFVAKMILL